MSVVTPEQLALMITAYDNTHEPKPAFNEPDTIYGLVIFFMIVSWICVSLRVYTRITLGCLGWDDLCVVLFRISGTIGSIFICISVNFGFGQHFRFLRPKEIAMFQVTFYVALASWTISTALMKICLLIQYLRIFDKGSQLRWACYAGIVVSSLWGLGFAFCALAPCFPLQGFWDWSKPALCYGFGSKTSEGLSGIFLGHTASNVILDLTVLAIPLPLYFRSAAHWKQRLGIGTLLMLGALVNVLSIWRLHSIITHKATTYPVLDPTWYGPTSIVLAAMEVDLASICASIPIFWPIITHNIGKIFVTQEVHVTHHHRRLSEDNYELSPSARGSSVGERSRGDSTASLDPTASSHHAPTPDVHYKNAFVKNTVIPLGLEGSGSGFDDKSGGAAPEGISEAQIESQGPRGFKREQRERFGLSTDADDDDGDGDRSRRKDSGNSNYKEDKGLNLGKIMSSKFRQ
ncbi:hypothetical protein F4780DRAFT_669889 [Xylariomycetidae sp. FL0641]|nr:hypothetical protein F4780DRAFT_669889 [Xylariomycetidae sp. FL0641]